MHPAIRYRVVKIRIAGSRGGTTPVAPDYNGIYASSGALILRSHGRITKHSQACVWVWVHNDALFHFIMRYVGVLLFYSPGEAATSLDGGPRGGGKTENFGGGSQGVQAAGQEQDSWR